MFKQKIITLFIFLILILSVIYLPTVNSLKIKKNENSQKIEKEKKFEQILEKKISIKNEEGINNESIFNNFFPNIKSFKNLNHTGYLTNRNNIDNDTIFLILFIIWAFINGGLAISFTDIFPYAVMIMEAVFFGLVGSMITGLIFNMDEHPLLEGLYNMINTSSILNYIPGMKNMMLGMLNITIGLIDSNSATIIAAFGWVISTTTLGAFLYVFQNVVLVKLITSGIWFVMPYIVWNIFELIRKLSEDSDQETVNSINMVKFIINSIKIKKNID